MKFNSFLLILILASIASSCTQNSPYKNHPLVGKWAAISKDTSEVASFLFHENGEFLISYGYNDEKLGSFEIIEERIIDITFHEHSEHLYFHYQFEENDTVALMHMGEEIFKLNRSQLE